MSCRSEPSRMKADQILVRQYVDPGESVGIGPYRVVNAREIEIEFGATVLQQVGQQERHFMHRQRILSGPGDLIPHPWVRRCVDRPGYKLVPGIGKNTSFSSNCAHQGVKHEQTTRNLPSTAVSRRSTAPVVRAETGTSSSNTLRNLLEQMRFDARFIRGKRKCILLVQSFQNLFKAFKVIGCPRMFSGKKFFPIPPAAYKFAIVETVLN